LKQEDIEFHKKIYVASGDYDDTEICRPKVERQNEEVIKFIKVKCLTAQELWEVRRFEWIRHFVRLGKYPNKKSKNIDEKRAGQWQSDTRTNYKKGKLSEIRIELLNNTEGWKWVDSENRAEIISRTFEESFDDWKEHFVRLGKYPSKMSEDENEKRAGQWQYNTRTNYKNKKLSEEQIELLDNTEGWKWVKSENRAEIISRTFEESFDDWKEHFVRLGRNPKQMSEDENEKRAGQWQSTMRKYYKKGNLSEIRIELLNNTEGWKWS
jgi:hypothetical protein